MSYYTHTVNPIGNFIEMEHGNNFEYSLNDDNLALCEDYPHKVWVLSLIHI